MNEIFDNAKFITTEYTPYFTNSGNAWHGPRDQKRDLEECNGLPVFIKDFEIETPTTATLYFTALGCADVYINGVRVSDDEMKPGWTDYFKRCLYCTYDVTSLIRKGNNRILAVVSPGWYCGRIAGERYGKNPPAFMACLVNGAKNIVTDKSWKARVCGPVRTADIWDGEFYNAEYPSYSVMSSTDYDIRDWEKSDTTSFKGEITPYIGTTVRVREGLTRTPAYINITDGVVYNATDYGVAHIAVQGAQLPMTVTRGQSMVIDFGQEIVGWVKIKVKGDKGALVRMRYSEFLNDSGDIERGNDGPMGSVYTINLRSALAKAYYRLAGEGIETYRPNFTFFGFRFVEITTTANIEIISVEGEVVGNDNREIGQITTSNPLVNQLISNIRWGQRGNYLSVPTDCPQRDERLGWTGDAQAFSATAAYNADVYSFFRKWMQDMRDSQGKHGEYADVNPRVGVCQSDNAAAWGDAGVIIPYNMYTMFGDTRILLEHYDSMKAYIEGLIKKRDYEGPNPRYGDWLAYDYCKNEMISSAFLIHDLDLMVEMSEVLSKFEDKKSFEKYREKAHRYFEKTFMKKGKLIGQTQADKVIALAFNLVDESYAAELADELEKQIAENGDRLSTGFVGTYLLCPVLSKYGKDKTAYNLLLQRKEPSWLYSVDQGATTIWERWNSYTKEKGFGDVGMNSFNHYAYGAIGEWMYKYMAGIIPAEPGFKKLILTPRIDNRTDAELPEGQQRITYVCASYDSANGEIKSEWNNVNGLKYFCCVPVETTLYLPVNGNSFVMNGETYSTSDFETENGKVIISLNKGEYTFEA